MPTRSTSVQHDLHRVRVSFQGQHVDMKHFQ